MLRLNTRKVVSIDKGEAREPLSSSIANPPRIVLQPIDKPLFILFRSDLAQGDDSVEPNEPIRMPQTCAYRVQVLRPTKPPEATKARDDHPIVTILTTHDLPHYWQGAWASSRF